MASSEKGPRLEEIVRAYFAKQGFYALRGVMLRYEGNDVTDVDIWLYARQSASVRTRIVVDVKNKKSPRALERVLWTKGLQSITGADRAIVVTTDSGQHIVRFGHEQKVVVLTKGFLDRLHKTLPLEERLSLEEFLEGIKKYAAQKSDGDWIRRIDDAKAGLISLSAFPSFNKAMSAFRFFAERIESRPHFAEQAIRCVLLCASVACVALDAALERVVFEEASNRYKTIVEGVTYGDSGDGRTQKSIANVLGLIEESMENGRVLARQAKSQIDNRFSAVRADIIAEYFSREHNSSQLVSIARELEDAAHKRTMQSTSSLTAEARAFLGVAADFVQIRRQIILSAVASKAEIGKPTEVAAVDATTESEKPPPGKLL